MNLKEAFRYQNKLQSFVDEAQCILDCPANITKVETTYLRRKVMAEAEDETVLAAPETEYSEQITLSPDIVATDGAGSLSLSESVARMKGL